jgi:hypothetical protein
MTFSVEDVDLVLRAGGEVERAERSTRLLSHGTRIGIRVTTAEALRARISGDLGSEFSVSAAEIQNELIVNEDPQVIIANELE